jgi:sigma-B regulation protein RsbU (phosphoserine phosphatase)
VRTGEIVYCNAGHNPPYLLKQNGAVEMLPMSANPMLGAIDGIDYQESTIKLDTGDALVMFTDGVTEAMNTSNEEFGEKRLEATLEEMIRQSCQQIIDAIREDVSAFTIGAEQSDDITMLAIKLL